MATPIKLQVVRDEDGTTTPETEAQVVVGRRDLVGDSTYPYDDLLATFAHDSEGRYVNSSGDPENEPGEGEWLVVVRKKGFSTVAQKLTFVAANGVLRATGGWKEPGGEKGVAATVSIVNYDQARGDAVARQSIITIRLFASQRYVGCGSRDHHGGTRFTLFASARRDHMLELRKLNPGAVTTLLNCLENETLITVKSIKGSPRDHVIVHREKPAEKAKLGILDFYRTLDDIGTNDPKSVVEAGVYGHSWHQGPIVQGTWDESDDLTKRDTKDLDGRPKDWYAEGEVATQFPRLKDAFADDARMVSWGCSHMVNIVAEASEANRQADQKTPRQQFFTVAYSGGGRVRTTLDHSKRSIAQYIVSERRGRYPEHGSSSGQCTYGGVMARALKDVAACFVATPGMGANFGRVKGPKAKNGAQLSYETMFVDDKDGENERTKKFFAREYGDSVELDELRYLNYTKFLDVALPDPGWSTERFAAYFWDEFGGGADMLRLPSGLEVARNRGVGYKNPVAFSRDAESGHLYVAPSGVAHSFQIRGPLKLLTVLPRKKVDTGIFVTTSGKTFLLERPAGATAFGAPAELPRFVVMKMVADPNYKAAPDDPGKPLTSNLIEEVTPKWFW